MQKEGVSVFETQSIPPKDLADVSLCSIDSLSMINNPRGGLAVILKDPFPNSNTISTELMALKNLESVYQLRSNQKTQTHASFNWKIISRLLSTKGTGAWRIWCGRGKEDGRTQE